MPLESRAAQFCPFAGLTGYDAAIKETARLTDRRIDLDDAEKLMISDKLQLIQDHIGAHPEVTVTFFQSDKRKDGGAYASVTGSVKKVDAYERTIVMMNGTSILIDDVIALEGELFRRMDEHYT